MKRLRHFALGRASETMSVAKEEWYMMNDGLLSGMGSWHLLGVLVLALVIAALIKYLFFR